MNSSLSRPHPFLVEFDRFDRLLDQIANPVADGYPPFNVEQTSTNALRIELAVAGFAPEDLAVSVDEGDLVVRGKRAGRPEGTFFHRGIATRQFKRIFRLAGGFEVEAATLDNGILAVDLRRRVAFANERRIEIRTDAPEADGRRRSRERGE